MSDTAKKRTVKTPPKYRVAEESFDAIADEVLAVFNQNRSIATDAKRFDWLYRNNPDGPAVLWTVRTTASGELAGFTAALPRRMSLDGRIVNGWNCADFSIQSKFRSLGIAMKLRRAAKEGVDSGRVEFLYAHPNERMQVVHEQVGHAPIGSMVRYAKVLRTRTYLERKLPTKILPAVAGSILDPMLRLQGRESRHRSSSQLEFHHEPKFDERFDQLFTEASADIPVLGVRDARYLKWRYGENPLYKSHLITASRDGRLVGYAIVSLQDRTVHVKDIFSVSEESTIDDLVCEVIRQSRRLGATNISVVALQGNRSIARLMRFGFTERSDGSVMFAHAKTDSSVRKVIVDVENWFATVGDRDVG